MGVSANERKKSQGRKLQIKCHWKRMYVEECILEGFAVFCALNQIKKQKKITLMM